MYISQTNLFLTSGYKKGTEPLVVTQYYPITIPLPLNIGTANPIAVNLISVRNTGFQIISFNTGAMTTTFT